MSELTAERLRELLHYDPETGVLTWLVSVGRVSAGERAGTPHILGYTTITIGRKRYLAHRLAWLHSHGAWPRAEIDHANGERSYNALVNLREATHTENLQNTVAYANNRSGLKGVSWDKRAKSWRAQIKVEKQTTVGYFDTPEAAHAAYLAAKKNLHLFNPVPRKTTTGTSSNDPSFTTP